VGSLKYTVDKLNCDNRHVKKVFTPSPCFVVNHDFRIGGQCPREHRLVAQVVLCARGSVVKPPYANSKSLDEAKGRRDACAGAEWS
jgi:hypothetical protein